ncbi:hypothetical protein ACQEPB_00510 [Novosphingobium fluoreni]|uniref:hypothetical protein n=1 Tax=Novosphingobium fluoreni TaxID=1391222 RepID=UPI003DA09ADF
MRDLPPALVSEIDKPLLKPFMALAIALDDPVAVWTGTGTLIFDDREWIGIGGVGSIDVINEGTDGAATGVRATLNQVPSEFRDDVADQAQRGALYELWVGALNESWQQVAGVKLLWKGTLQSYEVMDAGETLTVTVGGESRAIDQRRPSIKVNTNEWQQRRFPGDRVFEYAPRVTEINVMWAKAKQDATV